MMTAEARAFLFDHLGEILSKLTADTLPIWGNMTAQEMIEHLEQTINSSYILVYQGGKEMKPQQKFARENFLYGNQPYPKGLDSPFHKNGKPALRFADLEEAKKALENSLKKFVAFFSKPENEKNTYYHPFFGEVNAQDIAQTYYKHSLHHFKQFGLVA